MPDVVPGVGDYVDPSVDTLDVLTLAEARAAINDTQELVNAVELGMYVTAVSRRLDALCGPIVIRTVTDDFFDASGPISLRSAPVSKSAATTITSVTTYAGGVPTVLTAETATSSGASAYLFDQRLGLLRRRSAFYGASWFADRTTVVYEAGRYATTVDVDRLFKQAAEIMLAHLWRRDQGAGTVTFAEAEFGTAALTPTFAVPRAVIELLNDELRPETVL